MIFNNYFKTKKLYMLIALPFLLMMLVFISTKLTTYLPLSGQGNSLLHIGFIDRLIEINSIWLKACILLVAAYTLVYSLLRYNFLSQSTTLPGVLYLLMTSGMLALSSDIYLMISALLFIIAYTSLHGAIFDNYSNAKVFNFGFFIFLSVLFYPKMVLLLVWAIVVLFFSGRSTIKDITALLLGYAAVILLYLFYCFWTDTLNEITPAITDALFTGGQAIIHQTAWIGFGILLFIILCASGTISKYNSASIVNQRRGISVLLSSLSFLVLSVLLIPGMNLDSIYLVALPLSYYFAQYFILQRSKLWGDILFLLLIVACVLIYI